MNKRQKSEELWRQKFDETGLAEKFELVKRDWESDHGKKAFVRCKTCGCVFETWNVSACFRRKVKGLTCPECGMKSDGTVRWIRTNDCKEAMRFYADGHSVKETARKYGVTEVKITNAAIKFGVSNGRDFHIAGAEASAAARRISEEKKKAIKEAKSAELKRQSLLRQKQRQKEKAEQKLIQQKEKEERKAEQEAERVEKNPLGLSSYQLSIQEKYDAVRVCEVCGKQYTLRERMQGGDTKYCRDNGCCSKECLKTRARKAQKIRERGYRNHKGRARKYGCAFDSSVTLKALIKRNGLRCAICGEMCDPDDHGWTDYTGPKHPTIDHIIPMSKGGGHVWDNVQVAHAICNSIKRDSIEVEAHEAS